MNPKHHSNLLRPLPERTGIIHFVGIGGIGMSGIAEILHNQGYKVQGSDVADNANTERLKKLGIQTFVGHKAEHVHNAGLIVVSSAIKMGNPEVDYARLHKIPIVRRAEMLAEIMRLKWAIAVGGTHGKTTTTSLVGTLLEGAGLDPTVINGGIVNAYGTNTRLGAGEYVVAEADESDGSFTRLPATIVIVTNIDPEHMDFYGSFDGVRQAFFQFIDMIPFYGFAVLCLDHEEIQKMIPRLPDKRIITYGFNPQSDIHPLNVRSTAQGTHFDLSVQQRDGTIHIISDLFLPMLGNHNVQNAMAALAVAIELGVDEKLLVKALAQFNGVKRRFTLTGVVNDIRIIDDYGHHPVEIKAVLSAGRKGVHETGGRIIAVVQPHRYTRLQSLFEDFCLCLNEADTVIVADVYSAGEKPIEGFDKNSLAEGIRAAGHKHVLTLDNPEQLPQLVAQHAQPHDMVICLGAGDITKWANALPAQLEKLQPSRKKG